MPNGIWFILFLSYLFLLCYQRASLRVFTIAIAIFLVLFSFFSVVSASSLIILWSIAAVLLIPLNILLIRRYLFSKLAFSMYQRMMPPLSPTEKEALISGDRDWTADLLSGKPDWNKLLSMPLATLTTEEQAFLDGPVENLCKLINNWEINRQMKVPSTIWDFLASEGFFGIVIPKQYGGKEFSPFAHSQILSKMAGVSVAVATIIAVPNSLGPAELLLHYGTEEQKNYYLPRLAKGLEIPCFALTSPVAGSDASAITDEGIVCKAHLNGVEQLCIRLNWNKRYITLAPVATLIGLAFKLYDPDHLLGDRERIGITCAIIPAKTPGVTIGRRHFPLHCAFPNGPTQGRDVLIPISSIIGGAAMAGKGWSMLMENLAAGRSISLPSMAVGGALKGALLTGAYARIRRQFNTYIGSFGGIEEVLQRMGAFAYMMQSIRTFTISSLAIYRKPAVASAISKYFTTSLSRQVAMDAMDVHGGKGICMGPHNYLAQGYIEQPISITVEGANILTRSMMIFGQGAIRCHPYVMQEMQSLEIKNPTEALKQFDRALFGHLGFLTSNIFRCLFLGLTGSRLVRFSFKPLKRYFQSFTRYASILALLTDAALLSMGGTLKRKEKISGRFADLLTYLYTASAVLKYYSGNSAKQFPEKPVVLWICQYLLYQLQEQVDGLLTNFPNRWLALLLRFIIFPFGKHFKIPDDKLGSQVAKLLLEPNEFRQHFAEGLYHSPQENNALYKMENVLRQVIEIYPIEKRISQAKHQLGLIGKNYQEIVLAVMAKSIISQNDAERVLAVEQLRLEAIKVDDFSFEKLMSGDRYDEALVS